MAPINLLSRKVRYAEIFLITIVFLFFFELLTILVQTIFALNLLTTSLNEYVLIILFLLAPLVFVFFKKLESEWLLLVLGCAVVVSRLAVPLFVNPSIQAVLSGIGVAAFLLFFVLYLWKESRTQSTSQPALAFGMGFALAVGLLILFRTIGVSLDISIFKWGQVLGWLLGSTAIFLFVLRFLRIKTTQNSFEATSPSEDSEPDPSSRDSSEQPVQKYHFWKVLGLTLNLIGIIGLAFYIFTSPGILSRWTEGSYLAIVLLTAAEVMAFILIVTLKPFIITRVKNWLLWLWNGLFILSLTFTFLAYQPQWFILRQILLYLMILLSPVIYLDFLLLCKELLMSKPSLRKLSGGFTISAFVLILTIFSMTFTIAYDYIPLVGPFFRNKHWFVMMLVAIIGCVPTAFMRKISFSIQVNKPKNGWGFQRKAVVSLAAILFIGIFISSIATMPFPMSPPVGKTTLKVVTFNVQQGFDIDGSLNFSGLLADLKRIDADIIGLQESDTCRVSSGNNDLVRFLATRLHLYSYFGPLTVTGTFGIALLSKYPIANPKTHFMYSEGEQTATIEAQIVVQSRTFNVFITHFGEKENDKQKQAEKIVELTTGKSDVIVLGDFNFEPWSSQYNTTTSILKDAWLTVWPTGIDDNGYNGMTYHWRNPYSHIDFIFVSPAMTLTDCRVVRNAHSSDHMPVTATIQL